MQKKIEIDGKSIDLTKNEKTVEQQAEEVYSSLSPDAQGKYTKPIIQALLSLATTPANIFDNPPPSFSEIIMDDIVNRTIENSRKGIPTVLDVVPGNGDLIVKYEKALEERNFSCPTIIALAHCSIHELVGRMEERNRLAKLPKTEGGTEDLTDVRERFFPYKQYSTIFGAAREDAAGARVVGTVTRADVRRAAETFGNLEESTSGADAMPTRPRGEEEAIELMRRLGFPDAEDVETISVIAKCYHDKLYDTVAKSPEQIAKDLCRVATIESSVPDRPHPTAELINEYWSKRKSSASETKTEAEKPDHGSGPKPSL